MLDRVEQEASAIVVAVFVRAIGQLTVAKHIERFEVGEDGGCVTSSSVAGDGRTHGSSPQQISSWGEKPDMLFSGQNPGVVAPGCFSCLRVSTDVNRFDTHCFFM